MTLLSLVVAFTVQREERLPRDTGRAAHACFFQLLQELDPQLAETLHSSPDDQGRPFTVSSLLGGEPVPKDPMGQRLIPGHCYALRFTSLDEELSQVLVKLSECQEHTVRLLNAQLALADVALSPDEHPWAQSTSYQELWQQWQTNASNETVPDRIRFEFSSPTVFNLGGAKVALPIPALIFEGLRRRWNRHAPQPLAPFEQLERRVATLNYEIHCQLIDLGWQNPSEQRKSGPMAGFTGWCEFGITHEAEPELMRDLNLLADFAFYAGVGYKTTMGLGQVRAIRAK